MWALGVIVIIALVAAFLVLDNRSRPGQAEPPVADRPEPERDEGTRRTEAEEPETAMRRPEEVERDVYRELYAERSGEVRRTAAG